MGKDVVLLKNQVPGRVLGCLKIFYYLSVVVEPFNLFFMNSFLLNKETKKITLISMRCFLKNIETILHTLHLIPHKFLFNKSIFPSVLSLPGTLLLTRVPSLIILGSENSADP